MEWQEREGCLRDSAIACLGAGPAACPGAGVIMASLYGEIGSTGLSRWGGSISEEFLTELRGKQGHKAYEEMRSNDPTIGAILFAIEMVIRGIVWETQPVSKKREDVEAARFLETCLDDMTLSWTDFISEVLTMLPFGYSFFEIVYKKRDGVESRYNDGKIGWRKFAFRSQDSLLKWEFDNEGGIKGFTQMSPPDYQTRTIPIEKAILFRTRREKNNPEGRSILRNCYRPWYFRKNLETLEGICLERVYAGIPVIQLPPGASTGASSSTDEYKAKSLVRKIKVDEQMGITLPDGWTFKFESPSGGGRGLETYDKAIHRYRQEILMSTLTSFIALGMEKSGSYALVRGQKDFFQVSLHGWISNIEDTLNNFAVKKLFGLNDFGVKELPKIKAGKIGEVDLNILSNYIQRLAQVGAMEIDDNLKEYLRDAAHLPEPALELRPGPGEVPMEPEEKALISKPEETENYFRIPVPGEEGKHSGHRIRTIVISAEKGIKALYCGTCQKVITYLFSKDGFNWSMERAHAWVKEHVSKADDANVGVFSRAIGSGEREELLDIEGKMEKDVSEFFASQKDYLEEHWMEFLPEALYGKSETEAD